jgi:hypothetical protein
MPAFLFGAKFCQNEIKINICVTYICVCVWNFEKKIEIIFVTFGLSF